MSPPPVHTVDNVGFYMDWLADPLEEAIKGLERLSLAPLALDERESNQKFAERAPNRGTGAGGARTTLNGRAFEAIADVEGLLLARGFVRRQLTTANSKKGYVLEKTRGGRTMMYVSQAGLKLLAKQRYGIAALRNPDGAYIVEHTDGRRVLKILEMKAQSVEGSVDMKLWAGRAIRREYERSWSSGGFEVEYAFTVNGFLQRHFEDPKNAKFSILRDTMAEDGVGLLFRDAPDYIARLDVWMRA